MKSDNSQIKKWILPKPINKEAISNCPIGKTLQKVLLRRGLDIENNLEEFLKPQNLPIEDHHFRELNKATKRIIEACKKNEKIAICGDYDADGITSTVLLLELFIKLGAKAQSYIPSRQDDGYGLNEKIINNIHREGIRLVITVDNGISAVDAIRRSNELGIDLIITDHHKIPSTEQAIYALIHPENAPFGSPYKYLAGVGIAYILAINICKYINYDIDKTTAKELFCIGTIADMSPLVGANRKWIKDYLPLFSVTQNKGIKAIIKKMKIQPNYITTDDIGYKIAPLINAVGRIGDPELVIELLTTNCDLTASKLVNECFEINIKRRQMTSLIEDEALYIADEYLDKEDKFLVISKREWHTGIIGIVAARLLDRFNLPTAILSSTNDGLYRGSVRSNNLLKVNKVLEECEDLLISYGGHSAAGGFTIKKVKINNFRQKLNNIANRELKINNMYKSLKPDAYLSLSDINYSFYKELLLIGPFGIMNPEPIFWTRKCKIVEFKLLKGNHIKFVLTDGSAFIEAIKWNNDKTYKKNQVIDIAYYIQLNKWKKSDNLQLNIIDIKKYSEIIKIYLHKREYKCSINYDNEIVITNIGGESLNSRVLYNLSSIKDRKTRFAKKILSFAEIALGRET